MKIKKHKEGKQPGFRKKLMKIFPKYKVPFMDNVYYNHVSVHEYDADDGPIWVGYDLIDELDNYVEKEVEDYVDAAIDAFLAYQDGKVGMIELVKAFQSIPHTRSLVDPAELSNHGN